MVHSLITMNSTGIAAAQTATGPPRSGAAYSVFKSSDGFVVLGVRSVEQWGRLCELMGRSELVDASQADPADLNATVDGWTAGRATSELLGLLGPSGVPVGRVSTPALALADDDLHRLGFLWMLDDGLGGSIEIPANAFGFDFAEKRISLIGADTEKVLRERLGIDRAGHERLRGSGAFG